MDHGHTIESLILFEQRVAEAFEAGKIRAPIHLCSGTQAEPLLDIFREIQADDWVCSNWRGHFHALLKGVPEDEVFRQIADGRSMFLASRPHRFVASAIVGGVLPIACGLALAIQRRRGPEWVNVFVGDMAERTGLYHEFAQYVRGHDLRVRVYVEDNGLSTNVPTEEVWGRYSGPRPLVRRYTYRRTRPHTGTGRRVTF